MKTRINISLFFLGLGGQIAWAIENQFFNTFMYDRIIPDPRYVSIMVALSAITATVTAIVMGAFSDSLGKRKPFLLYGYMAWSVSIWIIPMAEWIRPVLLAAWVVIFLDSLMTFFGSTSYDAVYNAYLTDVTNDSNRGKAQGLLSLATWLALLLVYGTSGSIVAKWGYFVFFGIAGALVLLSGIAGGIAAIEPQRAIAPVKESLLTRIKESLNTQSLRHNKNLLYVLLAIGFWGMAFNVFFPYLLIYLKHFLKIDIATSSVLIAVSILVGGILASIPAGIFADKIGRKPIAVFAVILISLSLIAFSYARAPITIGILATMWIIAQTIWMTATGAWSKDLFPEERRGEFAGYFTLFYVAFTMIPGPLIGAVVADRWGIREIIDGKPGIIPTPEIFQVSAILILITIVPLLFAKELRNATTAHEK
ncbi:MAG: MFS transporter [Spirochaetes bacterium]|nr:MFS transporter [Spirochaetota bacterium]